MNCPEMSKEDCEFMEEKFSQIKQFYFNDCKLSSLERLPNFPHVIKIEMCSNKIKIGLASFARYPMLSALKLRSNRIDSFEELEALNAVKLLTELDLVGNPIVQRDDYRKQVYHTIKNLQILDLKTKQDTREIDSEHMSDEDADIPQAISEDEDENRVFVKDTGYW